MKKAIVILLALVLAVSVLGGCANSGTGEKDTTTSGTEAPNVALLLTGSLTEIVDRIYEEKPVDLSPVTVPVDLTDEWSVKSYTGLDSAEAISEGAASEPMIGSIAYSLVLVRVNPGEDAKAVAQQMRDGIDQRKWVCVEADDLMVSVYQDVVLLIMVDSQYADTVTAQSITDAFQKVCGGEIETISG